MNKNNWPENWPFPPYPLRSEAMSGDHNMYASSCGDGQRSGWRKRQILDMAEKASQSKQDWWKDDDALEAFAELVREDERELCAKVCDEHLGYMTGIVGLKIRARGQA